RDQVAAHVVGPLHHFSGVLRVQVGGIDNLVALGAQNRRGGVEGGEVQFRHVGHGAADVDLHAAALSIGSLHVTSRSAPKANIISIRSRISRTLMRLVASPKATKPVPSRFGTTSSLRRLDEKMCFQSSAESFL